MCVPILISICTKLTNLEKKNGLAAGIVLISPTEPKTTLYRAGCCEIRLPKCTWILRHIGASSDRYFNQQHFANRMFYLTSRDTLNGTSFMMGAMIRLMGISMRNILKPTRSLYDFRFTSYGSNSGFHHWPLTYVLFFTRTRYDVLESPSEVSYKSVKYYWVI